MMRALRHAVEVDLADLIRITTVRWPLLLILGVVAGLTAFGASFLMTPKYHAFSSILPSRGFMREQQIVLTHGTLNKAMSLRPTTASNSTNLVLGASYVIRAAIVDELDLIPFFGLEELDAKEPQRARHEAVERLRIITHFELSIYRDVLFIHVMAHNPQASADIANAYVRLIQEENTRFYQEVAENRIAMLETQLAVVQDSLRVQTDETVGHYTSHGIRDLGKDRNLAYSLIYDLMFKQQQVRLALARARLDKTESAPEVTELKALEVIYGKVLAQYDSRGEGSSEDEQSIFNIDNVLIAQGLLDGMHELEILENSLAMQLAAARMELSGGEFRLPILDKAFPPAEPIWPNRWLLTIGFLLLIPLLAWFAFFMHEMYAAGRSA
ncbi:MAG: hypothetical protein GY835_26190 [bacterium]|nr:hypothetical protein [bacterium]